MIPLTRDPALDGTENMARDRELLRLAESGVAGARIYTWTGEWVTLGRFQSPERDLLDPTLIPHAMRPTGGKAVLHGHDLTVGFAAPLALIGSARSVRDAYRFLVGPLVTALQECGVPAEIAEGSGSGSNSSTDCFAASAQCDVVHAETREKLCGCALRLGRNSALVQASIPYKEPLIDPALLFAEPASIRANPWNHEKFADALEAALRAL